MTPARAHAQRAQARKCCWLTLRHIKKDKYFGLCLWSGSQTMLILHHWYPFSSGTPMTIWWTLTTVHLLFSAGVTGRGVWWVWWSGSGPAEGAVLLAYAESSSMWLGSLLTWAMAGEHGRKVMLLLCKTLWAHLPFNDLVGCRGAVAFPVWGLCWDPLVVQLCGVSKGIFMPC